jgi:hypothetical protein
MAPRAAVAMGDPDCNPFFRRRWQVDRRCRSPTRVPDRAARLERASEDLLAQWRHERGPAPGRNVVSGNNGSAVAMGRPYKRKLAEAAGSRGLK